MPHHKGHKHGGHGHHAHDAHDVACFIITVSDTRTVETDESGLLLDQLLTAAGHRVVGRQVIRDEFGPIRRGVLEAVDDERIDVVILTGGTGVSPRDVTAPAVDPMFSKELPGFGERFRHISFEELGPIGLLSQATAGIIGHTAVFSMPGSPGACRTAVEQLIAPMLGHLVGLMQPGHR